MQEAGGITEQRWNARNSRDAEADSKLIAFMHPIRVIRYVREIERLRLALAQELEQ